MFCSPRGRLPWREGKPLPCSCSCRTPIATEDMANEGGGGGRGGGGGELGGSKP